MNEHIRREDLDEEIVCHLNFSSRWMMCAVIIFHILLEYWAEKIPHVYVKFQESIPET